MALIGEPRNKINNILQNYKRILEAGISAAKSQNMHRASKQAHKEFLKS
jgi:hypothetical protein